MFAAGGRPDALVVFVDAWTSLGGSQFLNSTANGPYLDYICDEIVPFVDARYPTVAGREHRAVLGGSSGGYGAMVVPMLRPDVFGAFASHAGDALFDATVARLSPASPASSAITSTAPTSSSSPSWPRRSTSTGTASARPRDVRLRVRVLA